MPEMMVWRGVELSIRGDEEEEPMLKRRDKIWLWWVDAVDAVTGDRKLREMRGWRKTRKLRRE